MKLILPFFLLLTIMTTYSQNCNCDIVLSNLDTERINLIYASDFGIQAGNRVCIPSGTYAGIRFYDIKGNENARVTITNCGGPVVIKEEVYSGITFEGSSFVHITGSGHTGTEYGFKVSTVNPGSMGVYLTNLSTDLEIDHIEVVNAGFAGIMAKSDPDCNRPETWRSSGFVMRNLKIHHNLVHDVGGEGIYIGYTGGYKTNSNFICNSTAVYGHWLENIEVSHNTIKKCGLDGIQLNLVRKDGSVHSNTISNYGRQNQYAQNFAMCIGAGAYDIYNNKMINPQNGFGQGIQFINAESGSRIFNNIFIRPQLHAIFIHNRNEFEDPGLGYLVANNTIIQPELSGIHYNTVIIESNEPSKLLTTQESVPSFFINNLIIDPGNRFEDGNTWKGARENYLDFNEIQTRNAMESYILTNLFSRDADTLGLKNWEKNLLAPANAKSVLVDAGTDITSTGITYDFNNKPRPMGTSFDIGAYEFNINQVKNVDRLENLVSKPKATIAVFPNPTMDTFQLTNASHPKATIRIFDQYGDLRLRLKNHDLNEEIDVRTLKRGRYFLKISFEDKTKEFSGLILE